MGDIYKKKHADLEFLSILYTNFAQASPPPKNGSNIYFRGMVHLASLNSTQKGIFSATT